MKTGITLFILLLAGSIVNAKQKTVALTQFKSTITEFTDIDFKSSVYKLLSKSTKVKTAEISPNESIETFNYALSGFINETKSHFVKIEFELIDTRTRALKDSHSSSYYKDEKGYKTIIESALNQLDAISEDSEWDNYFMPGISFESYQPREQSIGIYYGPSAEFVFYSRSKTSYSRLNGPSRIRSYGSIGILNSDNPEFKDIFVSSLGINLSFEANANRKFLIPYFGAEIGGMIRKDFSTFQFTPLIGVQLYSNQKFIWSVQGGYHYSTKQFDDYSGINLKTSLNLLLWK